MGWTSIDEGKRDAVVLRGVLVTAPDAYGRRGGRFSIGALVAGLYTLMSWTGSALAHLLPVIILMGVLVFGKREEDGFVSFGFGLRDAAPVQGAPNLAEEVRPDPPSLPDAVKPDPQPEPPQPVPPKEQPIAPSSTPQVNDPAPGPTGTKSDAPVIGTGGGGGGGSGKPVDPKQVEADPTAAVRQTRADDLESLKRGKKTDVVVVAGVYDRTEEVLTHLGVPHTVIDPGDLGEQDLSACAALIIDCSNVYARGAGADAKMLKELRDEIEKFEKQVEKLQAQVVEGEKTKDSRLRRWRDELRDVTRRYENAKRYYANLIDTDAIATKLRTFVSGGGYLFTSDWGLTLIEKSFARSITVGGYVGPKTVKIVQKDGAERHPMLRDVFNLPAKAGTTTKRDLRWVIDGSSYTIRITSPDVEVLVETPEINSNRSIVVTFRHDGEKVLGAKSRDGGGRVLHMLSHFADQVDKFGDYALQNMLINFLVERLTAAK